MLHAIIRSIIIMKENIKYLNGQQSVQPKS